MKLVFFKKVFKNKIVTIFIMSLGIVVIGFTSTYFTYTVHVKGGDLLLKGFQFLYHGLMMTQV
jgi:hypothetical protein